jgi:SAM-dependent methyltransferase
MGLSRYLAELIVLEHRYRPLPPVVHTLGRLFTGFDHDEAADLMHRHGVTPADMPIEIDTATTEAQRQEKQYITERTFFHMLGVRDVHAIDINAYEGADIIWDLCKPIPNEMEGRAEFIVGGSTLDNVFDPAQYIKNIVRLLRPGGRLFEINILNNTGRAYIMLPPPWFFDYFVVNKFADCRVYVIETSDNVHAFKLQAYVNPEQQPGWGLIDNFDGDETCKLGTVVFAEKGEHSTWAETPVQDAWRDATQIRAYNERLAVIAASLRPDWGLRVSESRPKSPNKTAHNYRYVGHF